MLIVCQEENDFSIVNGLACFAAKPPKRAQAKILEKRPIYESDV
jgi:hypothetical protein